MNQRMPTGHVILIGAAIAVLVTIVPVILLEFDLPVIISLEVLVALCGGSLGWLFTKLG
jgi:hypothetical protein